MKILGASNDSDYIVQLTGNELANVLGFYGRYDAEFTKMVKYAKMGEDLPISLVYSNYHKIKGIVNGSNYDKARAKLGEMLEVLKPIEELLIELKEEYETSSTSI